MSRKSQRLQLISENVRKRRKEKDPPRQPWTWKEKILIWGAVMACLALMAVPYVISSVTLQRDVLERKVRRWQVKYELNEAEAEELLEVELEYHGSGNPFSLRSKPTAEEMREHRNDINRLLKGEHEK
jgi:hypothetical protein